MGGCRTGRHERDYSSTHPVTGVDAGSGYSEHMRFRRLLPLAYAAVLVVAYVLVFVLPWHVAPGMPANSDSYAVGFSNRTSLAGALLAAGALFALGYASRRGRSEDVV